MIEAAIDEKGNVWMLVTRQGGVDREGKGGHVHPLGGGSACRWLKYLPADHDWSMQQFRAAQEFHRGA